MSATELPRIIDGLARRQTERILIGTAAAHGERVMGVATEAGVNADWFKDSACRAAWATMAEMYATGKPLALHLIAVRMTETHPEIDAGWVDGAVDEGQPAAHAEYLVGLLENHMLCEAEAAMLAEQARAAAGGDPQAVRDRISGHAQDWAELRPTSGTGQTLAAAALEWVRRVEAPPTARPALVEWPLPSIAKNIGPVADELIYLCALESVGKTALALQMAIHNARRGQRVAIRSLESSTPRLVPRVLAVMAQVDRLKLDRGHGTPDEIKRARAAAAELTRLPLEICDAGADVAQLRAWAMREKARGASLLIIDNLRHVRRRHSRKEESTAEQFSELSRHIKEIRDDVGLPLLMLHHLTSTDVSWSKDIRKDADILIFLTENEKESTPPSPANDNLGTWVIDFGVKKNRDGEKGFDIRLWYDKRVQTYRGHNELVAQNVSDESQSWGGDE